MSGKLTTVPPTPKQLEKFAAGLRKCLFVEHAAILAGIPARSLTKWIVLGRQGNKDFIEFVDLIDRIGAEHADRLLSMVVQAVDDGDVKSAQWLYKQKFSQRETALQKKWIELEEIAEGDSSGAPAAEEDLEAAERRLLGEAH
jgi:hypothetical protein